METKIALIGIIVEDKVDITTVNNTLSEYSDYVVGRMGVPYRQKDLYVISVIVDAQLDVINALSGKLGKIKGTSVKTVCTKK